MKLLLLSLLVLTAQVHAQPAAAPPAPAAASTARVKALEKQLAASQKEIDSIAATLRKTDERIESKVTKAVETLTGLSDSRDSGTRIADVKADMIDFLRKQITDYSQRRAQVRGMLDNKANRIPPAILEADIGRIDARLDQRIAQVVALGGSFARHEDYDKYEATGTGWYGYTEYRVNEDWKANRRATLKAAKEKGRLGDAIDDSVRRLKSSASFKESQLATATPAQAALLKEDIARYEALIASLGNSQAKLLVPESQSQKSVSALEAKSIAERVKKAGTAVRADQNKLTGSYNSLNAAQARHAVLLLQLDKATGAARP